MPRPKRRKITPSVLATPAPKFDTISNLPRDEIGDDRDATATAQFDVWNNADAATGATESSTRPRSIATNSAQAAALKESRKRRDMAIARLEAENFPSRDDSESAALLGEQFSSSPSLEGGRRGMATPATGDVHPANEVFQRRTRQPSVLGRVHSTARSSSVESNLPETAGIANVLGRRRTDMRGQQKQTPVPGRTASRVRSSSAVQEMATPGNPYSAVRVGMFKKQARQPSILGTARKERKGHEPDYNSEGSFNEEEGFNPEDESTPLNVSKTRSTTGCASQSASTNPRKRKLSPLHAQHSSPTRSQVCESSPSANRSPGSQPERSGCHLTLEPLSETMAPPESSSPIASAEDSPSRRSNIQSSVRPSRRQPGRRVLSPSPADDQPSSPPSLTHSPNGSAIASRRQVEAPPKPIQQPAAYSTVELQALLPRRRHRPTLDPFEIASDEEEVHTSGLGSDEDELTYLSVRTHRSRRQSLLSSRLARLKPKPKPKPSENAATAHKTYGARRAASDKDNTLTPDRHDETSSYDPDDSLAPLPSNVSALDNSIGLDRRLGTELALAKRKFKAVDRWQLDFEDVTASSSSPWDAR